MNKLISISIFLFFLIFSVKVNAQSYFQFTLKKMQTDSTYSFPVGNKKVLFVTCNTNSVDWVFLHKIDSLLYSSSNNIDVVLLPLMDFGKVVSDSGFVKSVNVDNQLDFFISDYLFGRKSFGDKQSYVTKWLTDVNLNGHFNIDITEDGQMFLLDERGSLFGVFRKSTPLFILKKAVLKS